MEIKKMGVVGAGQMGSGIAEVALVSGLNVLMRDVTLEALGKGRARIVSASIGALRSRSSADPTTHLQRRPVCSPENGSLHLRCFASTVRLDCARRTSTTKNP